MTTALSPKTALLACIDAISRRNVEAVVALTDSLGVV